MNDEHDNLGNPAEEIASIPQEDGTYVEPSPSEWADLHKLTLELEKARAEVGRLKAENVASWEIRKSLLAEVADTDKALKDALALIVYLASRE